MDAPRINLVTLGVRDLVVAQAFYEALGYERSAASQEGVAFYQAGGVVLALFGRAALAVDAGIVDAPTGFAVISLAWNVESEAAVDRAMARAAACGARIVKPADRAFWGGYLGYFSDPDGHLWEVAYNPSFPLDAEGRVILPGGTGAEPGAETP